LRGERISKPPRASSKNPSLCASRTTGTVVIDCAELSFLESSGSTQCVVEGLGLAETLDVDDSG